MIKIIIHFHILIMKHLVKKKNYNPSLKFNYSSFIHNTSIATSTMMIKRMK